MKSHVWVCPGPGGPARSAPGQANRDAPALVTTQCRVIIKNMTDTLSDLSGKLLVAMPGMGDPRFAHAVVYLCAYSGEGAMGLIVNKPQTQIDFPSLLEQLDIPATPATEHIRVHFGGPVEQSRGFVLHSDDYGIDETTLEVTDAIRMTATLTVLEDIAAGRGPRNKLFALGYAGWGAGQLEQEIAANGWLVAEADEALLFGGDNSGKWDRAMAGLGVDPALLSGGAGRA